MVFSAAKLFFAYGLGNAHVVPDVGRRHARSCCRSGRRRDAVFAVMRQHRPTIFYGCRRSTPRCSRTRTIGARRRLRPAAALRLGRRSAAREPRRALARGRPASMCSTASARPKCSRLSLATARATCATARPASRCPAMSSRSSTSTAASCRTARSANSSCADRPPARATGTSAPRAAAPSRANGPTRATSSCAMPRATTTTAAAPTTCSRSPACGYRRSRSRPRSHRTRRCSKPASSARKMPTA